MTVIKNGTKITEVGKPDFKLTPQHPAHVVALKMARIFARRRL